jgi:hypothetical protein
VLILTYEMLQALHRAMQTWAPGSVIAGTENLIWTTEADQIRMALEAEPTWYGITMTRPMDPLTLYAEDPCAFVRQVKEILAGDDDSHFIIQSNDPHIESIEARTRPKASAGMVLTALQKRPGLLHDVVQQGLDDLEGMTVLPWKQVTATLKMARLDLGGLTQARVWKRRGAADWVWEAAGEKGGAPTQGAAMRRADHRLLVAGWVLVGKAL